MLPANLDADLIAHVVCMLPYVCGTGKTIVLRSAIHFLCIPIDVSPIPPVTLVTGWGVSPRTDTRCVLTVSLSTVKIHHEAAAKSMTAVITKRSKDPNIQMISFYRN